MESVRKFALVPHDVVATLQSAPTEKSTIDVRLSQLDTEMKQILDTNGLPDDLKVNIYQGALTKFIDARTEKNKPVEIPLKTGLAKRATLQYANILRNVPPTRKDNAAQLIAFVESKFPWNSKKELVIDGRAVEGSDIGKLIEFASGDKVNEPAGWSEFRRVLMELRVPREAIGRRRFFAPVAPVYQTPLRSDDNVQKRLRWTADNTVVRRSTGTKRNTIGSRFDTSASNFVTPMEGEGQGKNVWTTLYR
jgi:hypothetical protein